MLIKVSWSSLLHNSHTSPVLKIIKNVIHYPCMCSESHSFFRIDHWQAAHRSLSAQVLHRTALNNSALFGLLVFQACLMAETLSFFKKKAKSSLDMQPPARA